MDLRTTLLLAGEPKEGDLPLGGTSDDRVRAEARRELEALTLGAIAATRLVGDGVSEALSRALDPDLAEAIAPRTVAEARQMLLGTDGPAWVHRYGPGLSSEAIAAIAKTMTAAELSTVARSLFNPLPGRGVRIGAPDHFGSRIQPNSPGDDEQEILVSILEGLAWGTGDVILGINPAADDVETIARLQRLLAQVRDRLALPTRTCVLSDIVKQTAARALVRMDVGFQSLGGTSRSLSGMVGLDVDGILDLARGFDGLYFETGQGSEVTNGAAEGVDMVTLESRTYGVARLIRRRTGTWTIVNDVAGFIGPEVFRTAEQLHRACLEDSVMAKLHGLTMGLDVCATFHMGIPPSELHALTARIAEEAAPAYLMAVAGNADPMLGYLTTSFREHPRLRARTGRGMTTAMAERLAELTDRSADVRRTTADLYARYARAGGDARTPEALALEGERVLTRLGEAGWDLGLGGRPGDPPPAPVTTRLERLYAHARRALYARIDESVLRDVCPGHLRIRTEAIDREDYLRHPVAGERIHRSDRGRVQALYPERRPAVQVVVSDGLNADAVSEHLPALLPPLRRALVARDVETGGTEIAIENGRVRAGYDAGALLEVDVIVHLIGERPGTGLNTLSAYLTYGRDAQGTGRWSSRLDHSLTTAICGIHPRGKPPAGAAVEIAKVAGRMLRERRSGVALAGPREAAEP
ncbi:MAG: ethanolamine ammonia-lyase subunit EutB [Gemmatimonadales bacterium]